MITQRGKRLGRALAYLAGRGIWPRGDLTYRSVARDSTMVRIVMPSLEARDIEACLVEVVYIEPAYHVQDT